MRYEGTLAAAPPSQLGTQPLDPQTAPARVDRDWQLVEALRLRAPTAAERLVATYGDRAYRLAIRITGNGQDAEEVVQDALWTVIRKIDSFRGESAFGSWLYRIVVNTAYKSIRGRQRRPRELSLDEVLPPFDEDGRRFAPMADWAPRVDDPAIQAELRTVLTSAINELPPVYRTTLVLCDVEGWSTREIAKTLGLSVSAVKARVHRARLFLRKRLEYSMAATETTVTTVHAS